MLLALLLSRIQVLLRSLGFELSMDELHEEVLGLEPEFDGFVGLDTFLEIGECALHCAHTAWQPACFVQ